MYGKWPGLHSKLLWLGSMELGNVNRSAELYQRSLEIKERVLGPHH